MLVGYGGVLYDAPHTIQEQLRARDEALVTRMSYPASTAQAHLQLERWQAQLVRQQGEP